MKKKACVSLDMTMTGHVLNLMIKKRGYTVSEIQKELGLSCPQPIYRWINGQTLPSIDNLYKLSTLLEVHMEDLILPRQDERCVYSRLHGLYMDQVWQVGCVHVPQCLSCRSRGDHCRM